MMKITAWISILFGLHAIALAIFAIYFIGNAENPLTKEERDGLLKGKPNFWHRVAGIGLGIIFCLYGAYVLMH
jgi:hypothetical protein